MRAPWGAVFLASLLLVGFADIVLSRETLRERQLRVPPEPLRGAHRVGDRLPLRLFDASRFTAVLEHLTDDPLRGFVWEGRLEGEPGSRVVLVVDEDRVAGYARSVDGTFVILPLGGDRHVIRQVSMAAVDLTRRCGVGRSLISDQLRNLGSGVRPSSTAAATGQTSRIDILFLVTIDGYREWRRKLQQGEIQPPLEDPKPNMKSFRALVKLEVAEVNAMLRDGDIPLVIRPTGIKKVRKGYKDSDDSRVELQRIRERGDGYLDREGHGWRNRFGADTVVLLGESAPGKHPRGYLSVNKISLALREWAYSWQAAWPMGFSASTLAHELGHVLGLHHNIAQLIADHDGDRDEVEFVVEEFLLNRYALGYLSRRDKLFTVMAYGRAGYDSTRSFSDPSRRFKGARTGIRGEADAARHLEEAGPLVADYFRCKKQCNGED